ncbi:MAG: hypothetical protein PUB22_05830 [Clostridiales bacterium]|nr:hypothetical protein [Clostridiales bacterium]
MQDKNRFSILLEHLLTTAEIKNATLAQYLQYDVSYISKWINGHMLPAEKGLDNVLWGISQCIVSELTESTRPKLYYEYQVNDIGDLGRAIYDHLNAEYIYIKDLKKNFGQDIAPSVMLYPELTLSDFVLKLRHPAIRRVKSLHIATLVDLMAMDHDHQMTFFDLKNESQNTLIRYPGVHLSLIISMESALEDPAHSALLIMQLMTYHYFLDFTIYESPQARGRIIFTVDDAYTITGMLVNPHHCIAVTTSEDSDICQTFSQRVLSICDPQMMLLRPAPMNEMLDSFLYIQSLVSENRCWLIGHMMEHFLPEDTFEELLLQASQLDNWDLDLQELRKIHNLTERILETSEIRIQLFATALNSFAISGELDFYNHKLILTTEQRISYVDKLVQYLQKNKKLQIQLIQRGTNTKLLKIADSSMFLSDSVSYLRLDIPEKTNSIQLLSRNSSRTLFRQAFEQRWNNADDESMDQEVVNRSLYQIVSSIELLARAKEAMSSMEDEEK